ncbi:MAG: ABC transporter ATP-binding protein [Thaumarchaeota archaeon]|jgi:NitT/TauT family transport system ATP-binding protein|nr:ABC transporter ATP-binding protein [Nitrososphaerota archaeon]
MLNLETRQSSSAGESAPAANSVASKDARADARSAVAGSWDGPLIEVDHVNLNFTKEKVALPVLVDVSLSANKNEFVALTGPSGCGKSTLLRIIAGLIKPSSGVAKFKGQTITEPRHELAMIFQTFVLLPWKTSLDNVVFGLSSRTDLSDDEKRKISLKALENAGLGGFENVYPGELSGGMKQRVGIARALALQPEVLLMDEPFSALDNLTADRLRREIYSLLINPSSSIQTVIMVSHNVEEIVELADRIVVLSPRPGHVVVDMKNELPRPRNKKSDEFLLSVDKLYSYLA